jgi:hypothetical protein
MPRAVKSRTADMRYITRYDYQDRHGWWVRIQRRLKKGTKPLVVSGFYADDKYGGRELALGVAKAFRDAAIVTAPAPRQQRRAPDGVRRGYGYTRVEGDVVKGWYRDTRGKIHRTSCSIAKWTLKGAQERAEAWLAKKTRASGETVSA